MFGLTVFFLSFGVWSGEVKPSFDCSKAKNEAEKLVCSDAELAKLDNEMAALYKKVFRYSKLYEINTIGRDKYFKEKFQKDMDNFACEPKVADKKQCLKSLYNDRTQMLKNRRLSSALTRACEYSLTYKKKICDFSWVERELKNGGDINGYEFFECSTGPVFYSGIENTEVVEFVANHGAKIGMKVRDECYYKNEARLASLSGMTALLKYGLDVKTVQNNWNFFVVLDSLKHSEENTLEEVKKLHGYGINVNQPNKSGTTLIIRLFAKPDYQNYQVVFPYDYERTLELLKYLISQGADVRHKDNQGHDALYYLQHDPYDIDKKYYSEFEKLLTYEEKTDE